MAISWGNWYKTACPTPRLRLTGTLTLKVDATILDQASGTVYFTVCGQQWYFQAVLSEDMPGNVGLSIEVGYGAAPWPSYFETFTTVPASATEAIPFDLEMTGGYFALRVGEEPLYGTYAHHPLDHHGQEFVSCDELSTATMSVDGNTHTVVAGDAYGSLATQSSVTDPNASISITSGATYKSTFSDLTFCEVAVPCGGISSANATGSGSGVEVNTSSTWTGTIYPYYKPGYADLSILNKWTTEFTDAQLVDAVRCGAVGGPAYVVESSMRNYTKTLWTFASDPGTWTLSDEADYATWLADPTCWMKWGDQFLFLLGWPLDATDRLPATNQWKALSVSAPVSQEVEFCGVADARCSSWATVSGAVGITVTNGATSTRFFVASGGSGDVARELVNRHFDRLDAEMVAGTPWVESLRLERADADEDNWCWRNGPDWTLHGSFTWTASGSRTFVVAVRHTLRTITDNCDANNALRLAGWSYDTEDEWRRFAVTVAEGDKGVTKDHTIDLRAATADTDLPRMTFVREVRFEGLVDGDDILYDSMALSASGATVSVAVPQHDIEDHFCVGGLVDGAETFEATENLVAQEGDQKGLVHTEYLQSSGTEVSVPRTVEELSEVIAQQQGWVSSRYADGDDALGVMIDEHAYFLRQQQPTAAGDVYASLKFQTFRLAALGTYSLEFEGRVWGAIHGLARQSSGAVLGSGVTMNATVSGTGVAAGSDTTNSNGYWCIAPLDPASEYNAAVA